MSVSIALFLGLLQLMALERGSHYFFLFYTYFYILYVLLIIILGLFKSITPVCLGVSYPMMQVHSGYIFNVFCDVFLKKIISCFNPHYLPRTLKKDLTRLATGSAPKQRLENSKKGLRDCTHRGNLSTPILCCQVLTLQPFAATAGLFTHKMHSSSTSQFKFNSLKINFKAGVFCAKSSNMMTLQLPCGFESLTGHRSGCTAPIRCQTSDSCSDIIAVSC